MMDSEIIPTLETDNPDVSNGGSPVADLGSGPGQVGGREYRAHAAYDQPPLLVKSFVKGVLEDYEPSFSVLEHVENRATQDRNEADSKHVENRATQDRNEADRKLKNVEEVQKEAADTEVVESLEDQVLDQELNSDAAKPQSKEEKNVKCASPKSGSLMKDKCVGHQLPPENDDSEPGFSVPEHPEHGANDDLNEFATDMKHVEQVRREASDNVVESQEEQEMNQELESVDDDDDPGFSVPENLEHRATNDLNEVDIDMEHVEEVRRKAFDSELVESQEEQERNQEFKGVDDDYKLCFSVPEHLEHRATNDLKEVDTDMEHVEELRKEASDNEVVESQEEQEINQELEGVDNDDEPGLSVPENLEHRETNILNEADTDMEHVEMRREASDSEVVESQEEQEKNREVEGVDDDYEPGFPEPEHLEHSATSDHEVDTDMEHVEEVRREASDNEVVESQEEEEIDQVLNFDSAKPLNKEEKKAKRASAKSGSLTKDQCVSYQLSPEDEGELAVFDLVWGKVKSHPWWPGQIFHPSDSSEKAMKYYKKDCYLVAYFGDRTFAWNDASVLKPFRNHFPLAERQNNTEAFQNAVNCALEEVSRRVELGLACSCVSEEAYDKIKYQIIENSGIREESSKREGVDRSTGVDSFQPYKLTEYVRALALFPTSGANRLELVIAKAQLLAFNQLRGYDALPDFQYYEGLLEFDVDSHPENQGTRNENEHADSVTGVNAKKGPRKRKHNLKDIVYQRRKEKRMTDLMGEPMYYLDGDFDSYEEDDINLRSGSASDKKKASDFLADDFTAPQNTKTISVAKVSNAALSSPLQSFKVGERIRRVASQMTGSSPHIKGCSEGSDRHSGDDADEKIEPPNYSLTESTQIQSKKSSLDDMLSQLHLSARDPMKGYSFLDDIISFFSEFRNLAVTTQKQRMRRGPGRKKKSSVPVVGSPETFQFDDRNDSYWTDMVVQGDAEAKPARRGRKRKDEQVVCGDLEKPLQVKPKKNSRKKYHHGDDEAVAEMPTRDDDKQLDLPAELMLKFGEMGSVPSELSLNKMFRCFGPLKESETVVDMQSNHARLVFKKRSDAEVAYSSAAMFNIFGSTLVNYQLNYTPSVTFKTSTLALTNGKEDPT